MKKNGETAMGRFSVEFAIANQEDVVRAKLGQIPPEAVRRRQMRGVIDTGATRLVLPESVAKELGLPVTGEATVRYADQRSATRKMVEMVGLEMLGRHSVFNAILEPGRETALIGEIVLEDLDLIVDCGTQNVHPRDPKGIVSEVE
jgi:predicted aspartyl protease